MSHIADVTRLLAGRVEWNRWAAALIDHRKGLEQSGAWADRACRQEWEREAAVDFSHHDFKEAVDISQFSFPGHVNFARANFFHPLRLGAAVFHNSVTFEGAHFRADLIALETQFKGPVRFDRARFERPDDELVGPVADFRGAIFQSEFSCRNCVCQFVVVFDRAEFFSNVHFNRTEFSRKTSFNVTKIHSSISFQGVRFRAGAGFARAHLETRGFMNFRGCIFERSLSFTDTVLEGPVDFFGSRFGGDADFNGLVARGEFSLADCEFAKAPNLISSLFGAAPRLDNIEIRKPRFAFRGNIEIAARYRALKRLAGLTNDHETELQFFADEMRAQRGRAGRQWHLSYGMDLFYDIISDYGRSYVRPIAIWLLFTTCFTILYCVNPYTKAIYGIGYRELGFSVLAGSPKCKTGGGSVSGAAVHLSLKSSLLFIGWEQSERLKQDYACLYGEASMRSTPGDPFIPVAVAILNLVQSVISGVLIFLFFVAVRNHFRVS